MEKKDVKKIVEWLCCYCTRGTLELIAESVGYNNYRKLSRPRLEEIAWVHRMLGDDPKATYCIYDDVTGSPLVKSCGEKYMIDWILKNCIFNWYDEQEYPIMRDRLQHKVRVEILH